MNHTVRLLTSVQFQLACSPLPGLSTLKRPISVCSLTQAARTPPHRSHHPRIQIFGLIILSENTPFLAATLNFNGHMGGLEDDENIIGKHYRQGFCTFPAFTFSNFSFHDIFSHYVYMRAILFSLALAFLLIATVLMLPKLNSWMYNSAYQFSRALLLVLTSPNSVAAPPAD